MTLSNKYKFLIDTARDSQIGDLMIVEEDGLLKLSGVAPSADTKNKLWNIYHQIDPNYFSKDVELDIRVLSSIVGTRVKVITEETALNIRKGPSIDLTIVGQAAKDEVIVLLSRANDQWWLIRTLDGEEGYCYAMYLRPLD